MVVIANHFAALFDTEGFVLQVWPETPDIHLVGIDGGLPFQDPFSHQHSHTAAAGNAVVGPAGRDKKSFQSGNRAQCIITVRGEGIRAVNQFDRLSLV